MLANRQITIGAMEVYFMGVKLFSKKLCNVWPNNTLVAQKCLNAYEDVVSGGNANNWEHVKTVKRSETMADIGEMSPSNNRMYRTQGHQRSKSGGGGFFSSK